MRRHLKKLRSILLYAGVNLVLPFVTRFYTPQPWRYNMAMLRNLPGGTMGKELASYLDRKGFEIATGYELHDVKHILLQYEMDAEGEGRLQFFLLGNGNYSLSVWLTVITCSLLMPDQWENFYHDLCRGKNSNDIMHWNYEALAEMQVEVCRKLLIPDVSEVEAYSGSTLVGRRQVYPE